MILFIHFCKYIDLSSKTRLVFVTVEQIYYFDWFFTDVYVSLLLWDANQKRSRFSSMIALWRHRSFLSVINQPFSPIYQTTFRNIIKNNKNKYF